MHKKYFYSHLITLEHVKMELSGLDLSDKQKSELLDIAQRQIHHVMMDQALTHIKGEDKKKFLEHIANEEHEQAWNVLRTHVKDAEKHLLYAAHEIYEQLREDIRSVK